ncbi:hypothetical protein CHS0354_008128 [Potamilus streckersoni]|uniref:EF-hand domain-containing protein n=1 Tax=Potamilus streckersoni TaxID=2493646 RepID=A0AAE0W3S6_9BIVA|nr:hypothetical protein CHS0354_008128 [Potamilus streckersoni]
MTMVLFGLLCLWCVSVSETETNEVTVVATGLFEWMDGQENQDNNITFDEFKQAWTSRDTNNDGYLSENEVKTALETLNLGPTSFAETLFGSTDIKNETSLQELFNDIDESDDGYINQTEFLDYYETGDAFVDFIDNGNQTWTENGTLIITSKVHDSSVPDISFNIEENLEFPILQKHKRKLNQATNGRNN